MIEVLPRPWEGRGCAECGSPATHRITFTGARVFACQDHTTTKTKETNSASRT